MLLFFKIFKILKDSLKKVLVILKYSKIFKIHKFKILKKS